MGTEMDWMVLQKGTLLGFSIAAPVGPIGLLCFRRTLRSGMAAGFTSGLGAASADLLYGLVAAFGLAASLSRVIDRAAWLEVGGAAFLIYLGMRIFRERPAAEAREASEGGLWLSFATTFLLTVSNPMTVLSFVAMFAGMGLGAAEQGPFCLAAGVFLGSAAWWLCLSAAGAVLRERMTARGFCWLNRVSGVVVAGFGLHTLLARF